jgi:hypothetical protein
LEDCEVRNNYVGEGGSAGGIDVSGGEVRLLRTRVADNAADGAGGLMLAGSVATLDQVVLEGNEVDGSGGAFYALSGTVDVLRSVLLNNTAGTGGAIYNFGATVRVTSSTISGNQAYLAGGVYDSGSNGGRVELVHTTVTGNSSQLGATGVVSVHGARDATGVLLTHSIVAGNGPPGERSAGVQR